MTQKPVQKVSDSAFPPVTQLFLEKVKKHPVREVFFQKQGGQYSGISWRTYYESVQLLSLGLMSLGLKPQDKVCIISNTRLEWAAADMATLGARAITVPIYASNTAQDTAYIINHSEAKIVFVEDDKQLQKVLEIRKELPGVSHIVVFEPQVNAALAQSKDVLSLEALKQLGKRDLERKGSAFEDNLKQAKPEDILTICYTSGTTGLPKGVVLTFDNLSSILEDVQKVISAHVSDQDVMLSFLPISHIFGKVESMLVYHFGWRVYYAESIEKLFFNIAEAKPTLLFAVPRIFEKAYNKITTAAHEGSALKQKIFKWAVASGRAYYGKIWKGKAPHLVEKMSYEVARKLVFSKIHQKFGGRIRYCIAGGAPLPKEIAEFMQTVGMTILEGYGLTETCAPVTLNTPDNYRFGTIGKPLPEVTLKIAKDGEILVRSRKVFREYFKNPEATAEALSDGWFCTGDIGTIDDDGYVKITDRKKDLIITSGGKNIAPQKLENLLKTQRFISQAVVVGDRRNYLATLLVLEREDVIKYARENNILFSEYSGLVRNEKILKLAQRAIDNVNQQLATFESIKRFSILTEDFSVQTGELTPSLKVKRAFVTKKYKSLIDDLYGKGELS